MSLSSLGVHLLGNLKVVDAVLYVHLAAALAAEVLILSIKFKE